MYQPGDTSAFAARSRPPPRVSGLNVPLPNSACLRLFPPFLALSVPLPCHPLSVSL